MARDEAMIAHWSGEFLDLARNSETPPSLTDITSGWGVIHFLKMARDLKVDPHIPVIIQHLETGQFIDHNVASIGRLSLEMDTVDSLTKKEGDLLSGLSTEDKEIVLTLASAMREALGKLPQ